jgi:dipeptidyl-peptidase-4
MLTRYSCLLLLLSLCPSLLAQDRLKTMPGYERYTRVAKDSVGAYKSGALSVTWVDGGVALEFRKDGKRYVFDIIAGKASELSATNQVSTNRTGPPAGRRGQRARTANSGERPARGRQYASAISPDEKFRAIYRDHNLWLTNLTDKTRTAVTTDGSEASRVKYGSGTWVYGEELDQNTAMWWSGDSDKIAFYRFDESQVPDYHVVLDHTRVQTRLDKEAYPKAGSTNPLVDVLIYDLATRKTTKVDVRSGEPFADATVGHYVYGISWTADSKELLFHRTNRRQNILELCAADPATGTVRVVLREDWPTGWVENSPLMQFLQDGKRFLWISERTGWRNIYLYSLEGKLLRQLTDHAFEVASIVDVDEEGNQLFYTARSGDNPLKFQLHRVSLDGSADRRLTDPALHHSVQIAPDRRHFVDIAQDHDTPPTTALRKIDGKLVATLAESDLQKFRKLGLKTVELLEFKAADGVTDLYGMLHFPSNFRPYKKYPLLVSVYAGPATGGASETFTTPSSLTEYGFLYATFDSRSANGRGKRFLDSIYEKLGTVEIDDQAAGVKSLWPRRYVDRKRVGIFGTSYGGTASAMCLMRYPEVFHAACASAGVMDMRNYDTIYTERYLWLPQENKAAYDAAAVISHVGNMKGRLMLFFGTADDNVHPSNTLQLVQALQRAGKSFELQVGPDQGHTGLNRERMMEFFIENLVMK